MGTLQDIYAEASAAFNRHDGETLASYFAGDCILTAPGGMTARGPQEIRDFIESWFTAFPDCTSTARRVLYTEDTIIEEGTFRGTQTGVFHTPMGDVPPTNRAVEGDYVDVYTVKNGKVVTDHLIFDRLQLLEQLGLAPTPAAAAQTR